MKRKCLYIISAVVAIYFIYMLGYLIGIGDVKANEASVLYMIDDGDSTLIEDNYRYIDGEWVFMSRTNIPYWRRQIDVLVYTTLDYDRNFKLWFLRKYGY